MKVRLLHNCSIPNARWCEPIGWEPANEITGAEFIDGSWLDDEEEVAGIVWFGDRNAYGVGEVIEANVNDLRVVSSGNCRVIDEVRLEHGRDYT